MRIKIEPKLKRKQFERRKKNMSFRETRKRAEQHCRIFAHSHNHAITKSHDPRCSSIFASLNSHKLHRFSASSLKERARINKKKSVPIFVIGVFAVL